MFGLVGGQTGLIRLPAGPAQRQHRARPIAAQNAGAVDSAISAGKQAAKKVQEAAEEIYIGFEKGDYAPRIGRKGRVLKDDPTKYPDRTVLTGGWSGGEAGLKQWIEENGGSGEPPKALKKKSAAPPASKVAKAFGSPIYIGFEKDDFDSRKSGLMGRVIKDDPKRYPDKESIGPLDNVVGGFAGGERGVKIFVEEGDFIIADPEEAQKQFSPLVVAAIVSLGVSAAAILLSSLGNVGEEIIEGTTTRGSAPIDDQTKTLLIVALGLLGVTATIAGARAAVLRLQQGTEQVVQNTINFAKIGVFWVGVALAAKFVIESS